MKKILVAVLLAMSTVKIFAAPEPSARVTENFDAGWRFLQADAPGAQQPDFSDAGWRTLDVPHDWSIAGPFAKTNPAGGAGAFLPSGVAWYRKHFSLPQTDSGKSFTIEFGGVMANSDVWINGFHLGHRPFGYVSFSHELNGHLNFGGDNVIAVRADTSAQPASRWYAGAGIYRHVRLVATDLVHIVENGVFISTPQISATQATVHVQCTVTNESDSSSEIFVMITLLDPDRKNLGAVESISQTLAAGKSAQIDQDFAVMNPQLWNLDKPFLYSAAVAVQHGYNGFPGETVSSLSQTLDSDVTSFGIRDAHFEADTGFWLNGKNFKIKGVCLHEDGGAFGAAIPLAVWEDRLKTLKTLGVNAIRTAHNPPAPEFLDLCDRMGFLVMDEMFDCWTVAKNPFDYHLYFNDWSQTDERAAILRDRNHPSVIIYSVGNEIHDTPQAEKAKKILSGLVAVAHATDPTRPVTQALFRPNVSHDYDNGLADLLDVVGQNYRVKEILAAHDQKPSRKILGTENTHDRDQWLAMRDHAAYAGQFLWTGVDYLGEARHWPTIGAGAGLLDRTGAIKPVGFERQSWWSDKPMVFIARRIAARKESGPADPGFTPLDRRPALFPDWTPENLSPHNENVEVYSNCKEVELFLNGKSLGTKIINADASPRNWQVPFAPGTLKAVARDANGKSVAVDELKTAGKPVKIVLSADKKKVANDWNDVCEITATITDKNGIIVPQANNAVSFQISGPGEIAAVDNGNNSSHEPFQASQRSAFQGRCVAFVKAAAPTGKLILTASAPGLTADSITFTISKPLSY